MMNRSNGLLHLFSKYGLLTIAFVCSFIVLSNGYVLGFGIRLDSLLAFWFPILILGFLTFYTALTLDSKFPLVFIIIFAFTLHMLQFVRQPPNMIWNIDSIFVLQVVERILETGSYDFGLGTGMAYAYSFYPLFHIFLSVLSSITSLPSILIVKYSMAILNLVVLFGFYAMLGLFKLDLKSKNVIVAMFTLNPMFHFFNSYAHPESYAIIFFPLILLYALKKNKSHHSKVMPVMAMFMIIVVSMSHHFTSYMIAFALVATTILLYIVSRRTFMRTELFLLALIAPLTWLMFVSYFLFTKHLGTFVEILNSLTSLHTMVGYSVSSSQTSYTHYPSELSMQITLLRNFMLVSFTFLGFLIYRKHKERAYSFFGSLLILSSAITFVSLFIVDWAQTSSPTRTRLVEFAFFPIAIFFALGIMKVSPKFGKILPTKGLKTHLTQTKFITLMLVSLLATIFVPSTIFNAFSRHNYDSTYSPYLSDEVSVAPETQYHLSKWVLLYVNQSEECVYAGSLSAYKYVIGYSQEKRWASEIFNTASIREGMQQSWYMYILYYIVNRWNFQLPDYSGRKMDESITIFLNENFCRLYDNGVVEFYRQATFPKM